MQLNLFGRFELLGPDGAALELSGKKIQALVAFVAVEAQRAHTRDRLANLLWADTGHERARHNLRQALSKIRRTCETLLKADDDSVALDGRCGVDVREFERLVCGSDAGELQRALVLYRQDLLEGFTLREPGFDDWLSDARRRLRLRACASMERLADLLADDDRLEEAMDLLRRRLSVDPACEEAHRNLMRLLARGGRRSEALRQYEECVLALRRELGARPGAETTTAFEEIRAGAGADASPSVASIPAAAATPAVVHEAPSIAVLPFENLSADDQRYFSDGITESIITSLCHFGSLIVIARASSFSYRGSDAPPAQIGRELGAQFLLEGSVQREGQQVRIHVQLLEAATGRHVWAQRFDREVHSVFVLQDEVTETVVSTLVGRVEAARVARARRIPDERLDAYDLLLRGKEHYHAHTAQACSSAIEVFRRATERDPEFGAAHGWLACALGQAMGFRPKDAGSLADRAVEAVERGLQIDPDDSECHRIVAQVCLLRREHERAISHSERALRLNPNDDRVVCGMGEILAYVGRFEEAEKWLRKAMRLNPYYPDSYRFHLGRALFHQGHYGEALNVLREIASPRRRELAFRAAAAIRVGDAEDLRRTVAALRSGRPRFDVERFVRGLHYRKEADRPQLLEALRDAGL